MKKYDITMGANEISPNVLIGEGYSPPDIIMTRKSRPRIPIATSNISKFCRINQINKRRKLDIT